MLPSLHSLTHTHTSQKIPWDCGATVVNGCTFTSLRPGHLCHMIIRPCQPVTFLSPLCVQLRPLASLSAAPHKAQVPQDPSFAGRHFASSSIIAQEGLAGQNQAGVREALRSSVSQPLSNDDG